MAIVHRTRPHRLLRLAAAAIVLTLAGVIGTAHTTHADGPAALGVAGVATTETETETAAEGERDVHYNVNINVTFEAIKGVPSATPPCKVRAVATYAYGGQPVSMQTMTFRVVSGPNVGDTATATTIWGVATASLPRPQGSTPNVIRASTSLGDYHGLSMPIECHSQATMTVSALGCESAMPINTPFSDHC